MLSDPKPQKFPRPIGDIVLRHSIHSELGTLAKSFRKKGVREIFSKINYEPQLWCKILRTRGFRFRKQGVKP